MDMAGLKDALSLADQYGIGWVFALGEAIILVILGRWLAIGKLTPGKNTERIEAQRDEAVRMSYKAIEALDRNTDVLEKYKPAALPGPEHEGGG